jgi:N-acetylglutamate synthase-like GNAT family acetyltransferase
VQVEIREAKGGEDRDWLATLWRDEWGGETMVSRGRIHRLDDQRALIAWEGDSRIGAATYDARGDEWEVTSLNALFGGRGVGSALLATIESAAKSAGAARVWLITTNDNLHALGFYQRRRYRLVAVHPGAVDEARKLKPSIPEIGNDGIPVHDEIELEKRLNVESGGGPAPSVV